MGSGAGRLRRLDRSISSRSLSRLADQVDWHLRPSASPWGDCPDGTDVLRAGGLDDVVGDGFDAVVRRVQLCIPSPPDPWQAEQCWLELGYEPPVAVIG